MMGSGGCESMLVSIEAQLPGWKRLVLADLGSYAYQHGPIAAEQLARISHRRAAAEPARRGRVAASDAQRSEPANSRPRGAARLRAVRAARPARRAQRGRRGLAAQRRAGARAARRWRAGRGRCGERVGAAIARDHAAVVRATLAAAAHRTLARTSSEPRARDRCVTPGRRSAARRLSRRVATRPRTL